MKNLMKAPINSTTESCPRRNPCVKDSLSIVSFAHLQVYDFYDFTISSRTRMEPAPARFHLNQVSSKVKKKKIEMVSHFENSLSAAVDLQTPVLAHCRWVV